MYVRSDDKSQEEIPAMKKYRYKVAYQFRAFRDDVTQYTPNCVDAFFERIFEANNNLGDGSNKGHVGGEDAVPATKLHNQYHAHDCTDTSRLSRREEPLQQLKGMSLSQYNMSW